MADDQRQQRRSSFRSVPAHRIVGGGLGRRYDHAARLSDGRYADEFRADYPLGFGPLASGQQRQRWSGVGGRGGEGGEGRRRFEPPPTGREQGLPSTQQQQQQQQLLPPPSPPPTPPPPGPEAAQRQHEAGAGQEGRGGGASRNSAGRRRRRSGLPDSSRDGGTGEGACPPGAEGSMGAARGLPRLLRADGGGGGARVASLASLSLEAMVSAWESHSASDYLPRAYHMPHELCARLLRLLVSSEKLTAFTLSGFLSPAALEVDLSGCSYVPKSVFKQIGFSCPRIIHLNLSMCSQVNNAIVRSVLQGCSALRQLYLDGCRHVTDAGFHLQQSPFYVLLGAVSLETISVQGCPQVTGDLVLHLRKVCRNLKELDLARCKSVSSASVRRLFDSCPTLESLNVAFLEGVVDEAFEGLPAIDVGVNSAARGAPAGLAHREARQGWRDPAEQEDEEEREERGAGRQVGGGDPPPLPPPGNADVIVPSLPSSSLQLMSPPREAPLVSSCSSSSLPALRHLNLGRCGGVTDLALSRVAGAFPWLEGVHLEHCLRVTDVAVTALSVGCRGLRALGLRNCGQITDGALEALSVHCPSLEWLDLSWCGGITDRGFCHLAEGCSGLEEVLAVWCEGITDASLSALSRSCVGLEALHIAGCEGVSAAAAAALRDQGVEVLQ
eukprot:g17325.t1